jgi:hypothetical protein
MINKAYSLHSCNERVCKIYSQLNSGGDQALSGGCAGTIPWKLVWGEM